MGVEKSRLHRVSTLAEGTVAARETFRVCQAGCTYEDHTLVRRRSRDLAGSVPLGGVFGYDVIVHVGLERFLFHRQREEIRERLEKVYAITASTGAISTMARRFLDYFERLHVARAPVLAQALRSDGGWPLHVDATGEDGRGTLLVLLAGWRGWALGSFKIPTERADQVLPCLLEIAERFGDPCAVVRDLGRAMISAVADFLKERDLPIPVLSCHFHFLQDVGKDLLGAAYGVLREMLRQSGIRARLRRLARDLGRGLGSDIDLAREGVEAWKSRTIRGHHQLPDDAVAGRAVVRSLVQWVLDFPAETVDRRFPFDRPLLSLYERCVEAARATDAFRRHPPVDKEARQALGRLSRALDLVDSNKPMVGVVASLKMRAALFDELRAVLRLRPSSPTDADVIETPEALHDIKHELAIWTKDLRQRRPERGPAEDRRKAIDLILDHLKRHGPSLFGHAIQVSAEATGKIRMVARTNNCAETYFRDMKRGERRRSGRRILTQDFERLPPAAALVPNLLKPDYVALLCGTLDNLAAAFANLDAEQLKDKRAGHCIASSETASPRPTVESASLPAADRHIVRSDDLRKRIRAAARSRAPRLRGAS